LLSIVAESNGVGRLWLYSFAFVRHNMQQHFCVGEVGLKFRGWLLLFLFAHVMLHPLVHAMGIGKPASGEIRISSATAQSESCLATGDQCELCRVGHSAAVSWHLPTTELLNPRWIRLALQSVNYASLQADLSVPSRAPPAL
jgi:hypothetical protein